MIFLGSETGDLVPSGTGEAWTTPYMYLPPSSRRLPLGAERLLLLRPTEAQPTDFFLPPETREGDDVPRLEGFLICNRVPHPEGLLASS